MSEYQHYEFQAIDRPLTVTQIRELRSVSTRATITPTHFVNEYEWGDFKGNPTVWIEKYFDAFFYYANWGSRDFMLRLPGTLLDYELARRYCCGDAAAARRKGEHVILAFHSEDEGEDWDEDDTELSALIPLRADLARGDHRCLYLAWLLCIQAGEVEDDVEEPPVPAGLHSLTVSLRAFADFLRIDADLIEAAAERSPDQEDAVPREKMELWISSLPEPEKTRMLLEAACDGRNPQAGLLARFRDSRGNAQAETGERRTAGQLLKAARGRTEARERQAREQVERERVRREQQARAARERYLNDLGKQAEDVWVKVDQLIATKQPKKYDEAVTLLMDLRDLATRDGNEGKYSVRLGQIRKRHEGKPSLIGRLRKAGLLDSSR